jgi:hypothetical protein
LASIYVTYEPLKGDYILCQHTKDVIEFTAAQYNRFILKYRTFIFNELIDENPDLDYLRVALKPNDEGKVVLEAAFDKYFSRIKDRKPYIYEDGVHYLGEVYNQQQLEDGRILHYLPGFPTLIESIDGLFFITEDSESFPIFNDAQNKMLIISPYHFESKGNLYEYNLDTNRLILLYEIAANELESVKKAIYFDEETVYFIKGFAFGTVTKGGQLYSLNLNTKELKSFELFDDDHIEITHIEFYGENAVITYIEFDLNYNNYTTHTIDMNLEELWQY